MKTNRFVSGVLGLSLAGVPAVGLAHSHYTGRVPASIAIDAVPAATVHAKPHVVLAHKKGSTAAKHLKAHKKHHHRAHKSKPTT